MFTITKTYNIKSNCDCETCDYNQYDICEVFATRIKEYGQGESVIIPDPECLEARDEYFKKEIEK